MKKAERLVLITMLLVSMPSIVAMKGFAATANVAITPSTIQLPASEIGQSFLMNIAVSGVTNSTDWETQILFNPAVLNVTDVKEYPISEE
jgi:hypothetical protein